jgi:hypothetical protein
MASLNGRERWAVSSVETSLPGDALDLEVLLQKAMIDCPLILALLIDEPDAVQTIVLAVIANPEAPPYVFSPR